jgi:hypothetical protein
LLSRFKSELSNTGGARRPAPKFLKRLVSALLCAFFLLFASKWFLYFWYLGQNCSGRLLRLNWKTSFFCASPQQAFLWKLVDVCMIVAIASVAVCVLFGVVKRYEA